MKTTQPRPRYVARLGGGCWRIGPQAEFPTITAARQWAESYGTTADRCTIEDRKSRIVASHVRDTAGNGMRWFRATP